MINVVITYCQKNNKKVIASLEMKGHANSAPYGEDLVCSAASAIVIGGINAINDDVPFTYKVDEGYVLIKGKPEEISQNDVIVLETIVKQLKTLEKDYAKFIKIEERNE